MSRLSLRLSSSSCGKAPGWPQAWGSGPDRLLLLRSSVTRLCISASPSDSVPCIGTEQRWQPSLSPVTLEPLPPPCSTVQSTPPQVQGSEQLPGLHTVQPASPRDACTASQLVIPALNCSRIWRSAQAEEARE